MTNTGPKETNTGQLDNDRQRRLNDQALKNYRAVADSQTHTPGTTVNPTVEKQSGQKTPASEQIVDKKIQKTGQTSDNMEKTDKGQTHTYITSRGRQVKPPAYLQDFVTR
jgi:hypothetical protein